MSTLANYLDAHAKDPALSDVITTVTEVGKTISGLLKKQSRQRTDTGYA